MHLRVLDPFDVLLHVGASKEPRHLFLIGGNTMYVGGMGGGGTTAVVTTAATAAIVLPNTGMNWMVDALAAISVIVGAGIIASTLARSIAKKSSLK